MTVGRLENPVLKSAVDLLNYADPDETGLRMVMADDLMLHAGNRAGLERSIDILNATTADGSISNADIKGLLNRASGKMWGAEYSRTFEPREFLAELAIALKDYLQRHPQLR